MRYNPCYLFPALLVLLVIQATFSIAQKPAQRPNIILILADDMGYSDLGCYGGEIATPNLDALAAGGVRFRNFYNAARCCPTRASLLTGLYPHEAGMGAMVSNVESNPEPGPYQGYLNHESATIAELLKSSGYRTYMSGKWHVGEKPEHWPLKRGFDRYFGLISGASSYFELVKEPRVRQMVADSSLWFPPEEGFYMTDAFTGKALEFLDVHHRETPDSSFFLYLAYTAPHWPLHALEEDIARYRNTYRGGWDQVRATRFSKMMELGIIDRRYGFTERTPGIPDWESLENQQEWSDRMAVYAAMIDRMDQGIGRLIKQLKETGQWENTLIMFLSDNGGCAENISKRNLHDPSVPVGRKGSYVAYDEPWANASNTPFRYYKQWTYEGGIATPFIAHWPAAITNGNRVSSGAAHIIDVMATCLDISRTSYPASLNGYALKPARGESLLPVFKGTGDGNERTLFWEHFGKKAVRAGNWKLVSPGTGKPWELYNLQEDPVESQDLSGRYPERVKQLEKRYEEWALEVGVAR